VVNPILLIVVPLGVAFLLPVIDRLGRPAARVVHLATLISGLVLSGDWMLRFAAGAAPVEIITGGWLPPLGINLRLGPLEAALVTLAFLTALGSALYLAHHEEQGNARGAVIQLLLVVGALGLIMTRDLFNTFVFLEIAGIGSYAIVSFGREERGLEAGFKYMTLGATASIFILLSVAFLYKLTGTLNIDDMAGRLPGAMVGGGGLVLLLLLVGMVAELKLFPLNGPAIDLYDGAEPGVMALLVGTTVNAIFYTFVKMTALFEGPQWGSAIAAIGMTTFVAANFLAIRQKRVRRMLGYSSSAQIGLLVFLLAFLPSHEILIVAVALLLLNHTLAKAALLWLAGLHGGEELDDWKGAFTRRPVLRAVLIVAVLAIAGLPPFPGFWGKWQALVALARDGHGWWIGALLVGSLFEFIYYFGWLRRVFGPAGALVGEPRLTSWTETVGAIVFSVALVAAGAQSLVTVWSGAQVTALLLGVVGLALLALRSLPSRLQAGMALAAVALAAWRLFGAVGALPLGDLRGLFLVVLLFGALATAMAGLGLPAPRPSFWGLFLLLVGSILGMVMSGTLLGFFVGWELMTWTSYLLVSSGRSGARPGFVYMVFSGGAGYLVLGGLMVASSAGVDTLGDLATLNGGIALAAWTLLAAGFAVKAAAWGAHIWAPDAYAESPDLFTPFLSGVISKLPIFGLAAVAASIAAPAIPVLGGTFEPTHILAWIGGLTAFGMTLMAVFQEDAKRLLAYSSVGQVGYIVLALAVMTPLGWTAALYHVVNHLLFKGLLFLAVAGVVYRVGSRRFSDMGGLIKLMPFSFVSVMIGIIALSGVPPLSGFAGKWLLYDALMERGWLLLTAFMMFASVVAFLYCFRLIHSIFLGQLKARNRALREAPWPVVAAQILLIVPIMVLSVRPRWLLEPLQRLVTGVFGAPGLEFANATTVASSFGYFNAAAIMTLVAVLFAALLAFLLIFGPRAKKVRQLDIVYAGEVPPPPEELHYAWAFFTPYERAFKPLLRGAVTAFWRDVAGVSNAVADAGRRFYTGNAQTYVLYTFLLILVLAGLGLAR